MIIVNAWETKLVYVISHGIQRRPVARGLSLTYTYSSERFYLYSFFI